MIKTSFRIDLGQGDLIDVTMERESEYTLEKFIHDIQKHEKWFLIGDSAIQKTHIKRIVLLNK